MKKTIMVITLGLLFIGVTVYAAGDLIVNGKIGVGTSTPTTYLEVNTGNNWDSAIKVNGSYRANPISGTTAGSGAIGFDTVANVNTALGGKQATGAHFIVDDSSENDASVTGGYFWMIMQGVEGSDSTMTKTKGQYGQLNLLETRSNVAGSTGTYTYSGNVVGGRGLFTRGTNNRNFIYNSVRGFDVGFSVNAGGSGIVTYDDFRGFYVTQFPSNPYFKTTNFAGIWIDPQPNIVGNAYGIVLNGDGVGSDIVFGPTQSERIYSNAGRLYAQDSFGNQTILSPHDPETGEWVYYSKNIKTGKVVKVNMEKLVKAVEKLTGEKFMIETTEEVE